MYPSNPNRAPSHRLRESGWKWNIDRPIQEWQVVWRKIWRKKLPERLPDARFVSASNGLRRPPLCYRRCLSYSKSEPWGDAFTASHGIIKLLPVVTPQCVLCFAFGHRA
jgi:hypothetical protein